MANETVTVFGDAETSEFFTGNAGTASNPLLLQVGDTLTVSHLTYSQTNGSIYVSSWASSHWTSTTGVAVSAGSTTTKTVKTGATLNVTDTISIQRTGFTTAYIYVKIVSGIDTTPNDFSGSLSNITGAVPSQEYLIGSFQVSGINTSVSLSTSGTASPQSQVNNNGTKSASTKTVNNGNLIYIYGTAPSTYNSSSTVSTTVGSTTVSRTITTPTDPATGTRIPFTPSSGAISLDDVRSFFGPKTGTAPISNYYRGGTYVINTTTGTPNNSGVPASGTIQLDDFYNAFTAMYFSTAPGNKSDFLVTSTSSDTTTLNWNRDDDWEIGFGPDMEDGVDYRITHETTVYGGNIGAPSVYQISFGGTTRDLTVAANRSSHTFAYSSNNANAITVTVTAPTTTEKFIEGKITFTIRHKEQPSYTDSTVFYYYVTIYGP